MTAESQFLSFQGMRVHFRVVEPEGEATRRVLMLCSPLMSTFHWRKLAPELTQSGCLLVVADLPGFGLCDCTVGVPRTSELRAGIVWGVLDEVDRRRGAPLSTWHLIAHGLSCRTALTMLRQYPDSVDSIVCVSPELATPSPDRFGGSPGRWFDENVLDEAGFRGMVERLSGYPLDGYVLDRMRAPLLRPGGKDALLSVLREDAPAAARDASFCPAMALWGGRDRLMDERQIRAMERLLPEAEKHVLKSAGHFPMETHSKAMRDYLRGWFRYLQAS